MTNDSIRTWLSSRRVLRLWARRTYGTSTRLDTYSKEKTSPCWLLRCVSARIGGKHTHHRSVRADVDTRAPPLVAVAVAFPSRDPRHAAGRCVTVCVRARAWSSGEATHAAFPQTRVPSPSPQSSPAVVGSSHAAGRASRPGPLGRGQQRQRRTRPRPPFCLGLRWLSSQRTTGRRRASRSRPAVAWLPGRAGPRPPAIVSPGVSSLWTAA